VRIEKPRKHHGVVVSRSSRAGAKPTAYRRLNWWSLSGVRENAPLGLWACATPLSILSSEILGRRLRRRSSLWRKLR